MSARGSSHDAAHGGRAGGTSASVMVGAVVILAGVAGVWFFTGEEEAAPVDIDKVVQVERTEIIDAVTASGRVEPLARVAVMSRAGGIVKELLVEEGDTVAAGQVLAELDREQLRADVDQDEADLASAEARLGAARARLIEAQTKLDDPELAFKQREYERLDELFQTGDVSRVERDDAELAVQMVAFRIEQVRASIPTLEASVQEAEANRASARAALDRSRTTLKEATIRSPIDGVVLVRHKEVGDGVSSILTAGGNATEVMTLGDLSEMFIEARVDEVDLGRISVGMPTLVTVDAHRGTVLDGEVDRIAPAGSVDSNGIVTFEVRVTVADPGRILKPDMTADAKLVLGRRTDVLAAPHRALRRERGGKWSVSRVVGTGADATTETVEVEIGLSDGLTTEIVAGLSEGDRLLLQATPGGGFRR